MKIDQNFDARSVTIPVGEAIELSLPENPTTGFRWALIGTGAPVCALKADDFVPSSQKPGAGGTHNFTFLAHQSGETTISLRNRRKWGDADTGRDFTLNVRVSS
ncbi:MAG TPA: protease inhibitor I42 family protein [Micropepsaceae bacterium]